MRQRRSFFASPLIQPAVLARRHLLPRSATILYWRRTWGYRWGSPGCNRRIYWSGPARSEQLLGYGAFRGRSTAGQRPRVEAWILASSTRDQHFVSNFYFGTTKNSAFLTSEKEEGRKTKSRLSIERPERAIAVVKGSLAGLAEDYASCESLEHTFDSLRAWCCQFYASLFHFQTIIAIQIRSSKDFFSSCCSQLIFMISERHWRSLGFKMELGW